MRLAFAPYVLRFKSPAGTSRGVMHTKLTYFIKLWDESSPEHYGIGEAALFPGLSAEDTSTYVYKLIELLANVALGRGTDLSHHSSIQFGLEQAIRDYSSGGRGLYFPSPFTEGKRDIVINGLVWMGDKDAMSQRIEEKLNQGFRCMKMKIGAIDWESELELLRYIRGRFPGDVLELRVDANGAFTADNVFHRLDDLAPLDIHSIEQPVRAGQYELMSRICRCTPIAVALDEELIGLCTLKCKHEMLSVIKPQYIILKPALCGGFSGAEEWIALAKESDIGWWVTSALESNVGLNAIAQWTATLGNTMPQGLGTGLLYLNNTPSQLTLRGDHLSFDTYAVRDNSFFNSLDWRE